VGKTSLLLSKKFCLSILLIATLLCSSNIFILPHQVSAKEKRMRVAVVEFDVKGDVPIRDAGSIIAEMLVTSLSKEEKFDLKERILLKKILKEQSLGATGVIDGNTAVKLGKVYGVEGVITGSVVKWGDILQVNARLVDTTDGSVLKAAQIQSTNSNDIPQLIEQLSQRLAGRQVTFGQEDNSNMEGKFQFQGMKFFEAGENLPAVGERDYSTRFDQNGARYIYAEVAFKNKFYGVKDAKLAMTFKYYKPDGSLFGEFNNDVSVGKDLDDAIYEGGWGWKEKGNWVPGTYTVKIFFENQYVGEEKFKIYSNEDKFTLRSIKFFESGYEFPPSDEIHYRNSFAKETTRYIRTEITFKNKFYGIRDVEVPIVFKYYKPDGSLFGDIPEKFLVKKDLLEADYTTGWGWREPGNWTTGTYTVKIYLDNEYAGEEKLVIYP